MDLNIHSNELKANNVVFAKHGSGTKLTLGHLHNDLKRECFVKV